MDDTTEPSERYTSALRLEAAAALRRLGNALVSHQVDDDTLARLREEADRFALLIVEGPARLHGFFQPGRPDFSTARPASIDGAPLPALPDCVISGPANPMGVAATFYREGDEAVCRVSLGHAFEGAPDRAHGGIVSAIFDHTMGLATAPTPAFTGWITVTYRAPTPLMTPLEVRARVTHREGRKLTVTAELRVDGAVLVEGQGLFSVCVLAKVMASPALRTRSPPRC